MFNFKLTPLWLFGIIIIVLVVSMLWYNNASIEGFGEKPADGTGVLTHYPDAANSLFDFGTASTTIKNYFDTNTGNIIREYVQTMTIIDRAGNVRKFIKDELETPIVVENDEIHKGSTYGAFSLYEENDDEQLFYISVGTTTFIHSINLTANKHGPTCVFDTSSLLRKETPSVNIAGIGIATPLPSFSMNTASFDISGIPVTNAMNFTGDIYYDPSAQLMILKTTNTNGADDVAGPTRVGVAEETTEEPTTEEPTTEETGSGFTLFNNRFTKEELEGFETIPASAGGTTYVWDIYNRSGDKIMDTSFVGSAYAPSTTNPSEPKVQIFKTGDGKLQVVMMTQQERTVILALTNEGKNSKNKYKLLGIRRYIGKNLEQPTTASTPNYTPAEEEGDDDDDDDGGTDISGSSMSEYWKWFHYWNADGGSGSGGSQPMSQDYMLKTDYVPMACPSCNGNDGKCTNCNNGQGHGHGGGGGGGGIVGTTGSVANNIIDKTSGLAEQAIDTGAGLAVTGAVVGSAAASGAVGLGRDAASGAVGLGRDAASGVKSATTGAVGLGRDAASGAAGLGRDAASGAVGIGREVVTGAVELGKDIVGGTADFIKDTQYANAGGYASGSNGDLRTRKYVRGGGDQPGGMDPYTYNGLLSKRGGSNYMPLTSDFSSFR